MLKSTQTASSHILPEVGVTNINSFFITAHNIITLRNMNKPSWKVYQIRCSFLNYKTQISAAYRWKLIILISKKLEDNTDHAISVTIRYPGSPESSWLLVCSFHIQSCFNVKYGFWGCSHQVYIAHMKMEKGALIEISARFLSILFTSFSSPIYQGNWTI